MYVCIKCARAKNTLDSPRRFAMTLRTFDTGISSKGDGRPGTVGDALLTCSTLGGAATWYKSKLEKANTFHLLHISKVQL